MKHASVCLSQISRSRAIGRRPTRHPNQKSESDGFPAERVPDVDGYMYAFLFEDRTTQARFLGNFLFDSPVVGLKVYLASLRSAFVFAPMDVSF